MKTSRTTITPITFSVAWVLAIAVPHPALCETKSGGNAQVLLEEAKKSEFERKLAARQTELDRLGEDMKRAKHEIDELEKTIEKVGVAVAETTGQLDQLAIEKNRMTRDLDLTNLRIEAEKLKADGLKLLAIAQSKARDALAKRTEELDLRTAVVAAKMQQLSGETLPPIALSPAKTRSSKGTTSLTEKQKQLFKAEQATATAIISAREAMEAASEKLQRADSAAAKAEKKRAEIALERTPGFPGGNDPLSPANP